MPIDTSMYGNQKLPDPMAGIGNILDVQSKSLSNRLLQLQTLGKVAGGQALLDAVGPDGKIDMRKFTETLQKNPAGFAGAAEAIPTAQGIQGTGIDIGQKGVNLAGTSQQNLGALWGSRLQRNPGKVTRQELESDIIDGISTGRIDPAYGKAALANVKTIPEDQLRSYATGGYIQALGPAGSATPTPGTPTASGAPTTQTAGQLVAGALGGGQPAAPAAPGAPSGAPGAASPDAAATAIAPATPAATGGPVVTGLNPGAAAAIQATGTTSSAQFDTVQRLGDSSRDRLGALRNMETAGAQFTGGPVTDELKRMVAGVNQIFGTKFALGNVAAIEEYGKLANQIALAQSSSLGITDLTTQTAMGANPNTSLSSLGSQRILEMLKGNEDAITAKAKAAADWRKGHTPDTYGQFAQDFNAHFDPRVFQSKYWSDDERAEAVKGMTADQSLDKFKNDYFYAVQQGWIPDPRKK